MRLKKWIFLFWSSLLVGAGAALITGLALQSADHEFGFMGITGFTYNLYTMVLGGLMFSVLSQMGFFAYLMLQYIAISIFRKKMLWNVLQVCLIVVILFDFSYYKLFPYAVGVFPLGLLVCSLVVVLWKVKMTNWSAFIPTLFFMSVVTVVEAIPALKNNVASALFMMIPLFFCNGWQILMLHRLVTPRDKAQ